MTGLEIVLIIMGAAIFGISFFMTEKLSSSDVEYIKKISEKEINIILEKELTNAKDVIDDRIKEKVDDGIEEIERATDKDTNDKLLSMNEFSDTVLDSMNRSNEEVVFLHRMLNEKEAKIESLEKNLLDLEKRVMDSKKALDLDRLKLAEERSDLDREKEKKREAEEARVREEEEKKKVMVDMTSLKEAFQNKISEDRKEEKRVEGVKKQEAQREPVLTGIGLAAMKKAQKEVQESHMESVDEDNQVIIDLQRQGLSEIEIAKKTGRGLGEIRLILGLFDNGKSEGESVS
ncbi:MAG: hypothetical protein IJI65_08205 [Lachnospiraceae bacterium]|nr:hypothetical protein [Lachnospiraceae bacterium]MBQ6258211.1 hypothetical protein [Lachnospiraceae bacterium]